MEEKEIVDFEHFFLPTISHFENGNGWKSSEGIMRFDITPPDEGEQQLLHIKVWYGPFCEELSQIDCETDFPMSTEGLKEAADWLHSRADEMNAHPARTYAECLAYRNACLEKEAQKL